MPSIWLSALEKDEGAVQKLMARMKKYGLALKGHFWANDNSKMAWYEALSELRSKEIGAWAIAGGRQQFLNDDLRYGLSMLALSMCGERGAAFPIILLQNGGAPLAADDLPTPLQSAVIMPADSEGTPAKLIARLHAKPAAPPVHYTIRMAGNPHVGQWLEIRPQGDPWPGIIFGLDQGEILFQAVGPAGALPARSVLEHPMQGIRLEYEGTLFSAWAVRNEISKADAYFVKIDGAPATLLFGPFPENDQADLFKFHLK